MKIGYSVEGSTDRGVIKGLRKRWCPEADLIEGLFRGSTQTSLRREYQKICDEFLLKDVDWMVFLTDANTRPWRDVQKGERDKFPPERLARAIHGIADRNIECWLCSDPDWLGKKLGCQPNMFRSNDPKQVFERSIGITRDDNKEDEIAAIVLAAPLKSWQLSNESFKDFFDQVWNSSKQSGCSIENVREDQQ